MEEQVTTIEDTQRKRGREDDTVNVDDGASMSAVAATTTTTITDAVVSTVEDLKCGICLELVENATQTSCCGGLWCRGCIEQIDEKKCPNCRADIEDDTVTRDTRSERLSAALSRSCKNEPRGCSFSGNRKEMHEHSQTCQHASLDDVRAELADAKAEIAALQNQAKANKRAALAHLQSRLVSCTVDRALALAFGSDTAIVAVLLKDGLEHKQTCSVKFLGILNIEFRMTLIVSRLASSFSIDAVPTTSFLNERWVRLSELNSTGTEERCHELRVTEGVSSWNWLQDRRFSSSDKRTVFAIKVL